MRVHLFGASGTGVTTLGLALAEQLRVPYFDSDQYFWEETDPPFTVRREPALRNRLLGNELRRHESWVLGGSIINWEADWLPLFDLVVFLWVPPALRLSRLRHREDTQYGDIIRRDPARRQQYQEFLTWAAGYDDNSARGRTLAAHEAWLAARPCPVLEIRGDTTVAERLGLIRNRLNNLPKQPFTC